MTYRFWPFKTSKNLFHFVECKQLCFSLIGGERFTVSAALCVPHLLVSGALAKHIADHRNTFAQRLCCKRQSHFVYIGQGKATSKALSTILKSVGKDFVMCMFLLHCLNTKQMDGGVTRCV